MTGGVLMVTSFEEYARVIEESKTGVALWVPREALRHAMTRDHRWRPDCVDCMALAAADVNQPAPDPLGAVRRAERVNPPYPGVVLNDPDAGL